MISALSIKDLVKIGGSVVIDTSISSTVIKSIVEVAHPNAEIVIRNASNTNFFSLKEIQTIAKCKVIFDFTE